LVHALEDNPKVGKNPLPHGEPEPEPVPEPASQDEALISHHQEVATPILEPPAPIHLTPNERLTLKALPLPDSGGLSVEDILKKEKQVAPDEIRLALLTLTRWGFAQRINGDWKMTTKGAAMIHILVTGDIT
jgi:hypothetical protein